MAGHLKGKFRMCMMLALCYIIYKYFFGPFARLRLYITYEPACKAWKAMIKKRKTPMRGDFVWMTGERSV